MKSIGINKRQSLIDAAKKIIYQQGFKVTTLSDIALEAGMPLGNVYYYFKTKDDIAIAVLEAIALEQKRIFQYLEQEFSPRTRLYYFLESIKQEVKLITLKGCRIGTACQELAKEGGTLGGVVAKIMMDSLLWVEAQFDALGLIEKSSDLSLDLLNRLQGSFLLGYALKNSNLISRQITQLQESLKAQVPEKTTECRENFA